MSFNIERQSDTRKIKTDVSGISGTDNVVINRDPFVTNPDSEVDPGMDYLVDNSENEEEVEEDNGSDVISHNNGSEFLENPSNVNFPPQKTYEEIQQEKSYFLSQLKRLEKKGNVASRRFTMEHSLDEIRGEVIRIKKEQDMDNSIDYLRQGLMFCVSSIEMADGRYNMGADLGGWSQNVMGNIESYDSVFEELYDKYANSMSLAPEIKLISMLAGSAFMFSLNKKIASGPSSGPAPRQRDMNGPSIDTDELMRNLNDLDLDVDDISSIASSNNSVKITEEPETKSINITKKRGRPPKKP